jgi:hypothetical protein
MPSPFPAGKPALVSPMRSAIVSRIGNGMVVSAAPPPRLMGQWWVVAKGDMLWDEVTATGRTVDRSVIEASARAHGYMGAHQVRPSLRLVVPR